MKKLIYTDNIAFDMSDWIHQPIKKVFAGTDCIMAVTDDGRTLQKITVPTCAAAVKYWTRISDISLSAWASGLALGLVSDGTCLIAKKPVRRVISFRPVCEQIPFDTVNHMIKSWNNIVQTEVSDAFFAVNAEGKVFYAAMDTFGEREYRDVLGWENISRIAVGTQNSIIGITKDGRMLCAGANLRRGPHDDLTERLASYTDVVDVCMSGSECECIVIAHSDGTVEEINRSVLPVKTFSGKEKVLRSHFWHSHYILDENRHLLGDDTGELRPVFQDNPVIDSFAVGDHRYSMPFVIAVAEI